MKTLSGNLSAFSITSAQNEINLMMLNISNSDTQEMVQMSLEEIGLNITTLQSRVAQIMSSTCWGCPHYAHFVHYAMPTMPGILLFRTTHYASI